MIWKPKYHSVTIIKIMNQKLKIIKFRIEAYNEKFLGVRGF